jgi:hypothetical protein
LDLELEDLEQEDFRLEVGLEEVVGGLAGCQQFCRVEVEVVVVVAVVVVVVDPIHGEEVVDPGQLEARDSVFGHSVLYLYREVGNRM